MFRLFAQAASVVLEKEPATYTPDWWLDKFEQHGFGGGVTALVLYFSYKYGGRIIEAFLAYMQANTETGKKLAEIGEKHQDQLDAIVKSQTASEAASRNLIDATSGSRTINEQRATKYLDLIELIVPHIAPEAEREARKHIDALRAISAHR